VSSDFDHSRAKLEGVPRPREIYNGQEFENGSDWLSHAATVHKYEDAAAEIPPAFPGLQMNHSALVSALLLCLCSSYASAPLVPLRF
jgi:hypothetical protein